MTVSKAERLLNLIALLLETRRPLSAQEIRDTVPGYGQQQWEAFKRMFERDKEELREMGIPVELRPTDAWESEEGYRIPKERYYLPDLQLSEEEVAALSLAAGLLRMHDPGAVRAALLKLAGDVQMPAEISPPPWLGVDLGLAVPGLSRAFAAVAERRRISFTYRTREVERARTMDPYGLVHRRGEWYVVGRDHASGEVRSFRLDRIAGGLHLVDPSGPGSEFDVPEGFRPQAALEAPPFTQGEAVTTARVRFAPSTAWWVEREAPWLRLEWAADGTAEADIEVTQVSGFLGWVLWFGEGAELLGPQELREQLRSRLEESCA